MNDTKTQLAQELARECNSLEEIQKLIKELFRGTIEGILEAETVEHLGYEKYNNEGNNSGNSRNGYNQKTIKTQMGQMRLRIPMERQGQFEPQIIPKHETKAGDLEERVIAMYPILFMDGIVFKARKDSKIINRCVYTVLAITMEGKKEILGIWISDNESASFWLKVCNELKNRSMKDVLITYHDNLSRFSTAISTVFDKSEQQLCVIHQIRNSTKYVSYKHLKPVIVDHKKVYSATSIENAEYALLEFRDKYQQIAKSWDKHWVELSTYFKYPDEIRRMIYTTNTVEGFHRMLRKYTKTKTICSTEDSLRKSVYLSIQEITKKWTNPIRDWGIIMGQLTIFFEDRFIYDKSV